MCEVYVKGILACKLVTKRTRHVCCGGVPIAAVWYQVHLVLEKVFLTSFFGQDILVVCYLNN